MKKPTNTTKQIKDNPILGLVGMMADSRYIENQEAQGQSELVQSDALPTDGIESVRQMIESNGGSVGEPVEGDNIFTEVVLPTGWEKQGTDHSMWSKLVDDKGRERAGIFYKAAFYDRSAHIRPNCRLSIDR